MAATLRARRYALAAGRAWQAVIDKAKPLQIATSDVERDTPIRLGDILHHHFPDVVTFALQHCFGGVDRHPDHRLRRNER